MSPSAKEGVAARVARRKTARTVNPLTVTVTAGAGKSGDEPYGS
jgi:hypothetical protein